jgi:hypothetical protein
MCPQSGSSLSELRETTTPSNVMFTCTAYVLNHMLLARGSLEDPGSFPEAKPEAATFLKKPTRPILWPFPGCQGAKNVSLYTSALQVLA